MFDSIGALIEKVLAAPTGSLLVIAGILFLFIAVAGNISGKIEPGSTGRIVSGVIGLAMLIGGLTVFSNSRPTPTASTSPAPPPVAVADQRSTAGQPTPAPTASSASAPAPAQNADEPAASVCGVFAEGIFSDNRDKRLLSQQNLIRQCKSDPVAVSLVVDKARSNMDNRAGVYDALVYLDAVPENEMHNPGLRRKIRDFAIAAANNSEDSAAISGRLDSRYR